MGRNSNRQTTTESSRRSHCKYSTQSQSGGGPSDEDASRASFTARLPGSRGLATRRWESLGTGRWRGRRGEGRGTFERGGGSCCDNIPRTTSEQSLSPGK